MSTTELKELLIERIQKIDNEDVLTELYKLLDLDAGELNIYKLSVAEKEEISAVKKQVEKGNSLTNEEANYEIDQWLKK